MAQAMPFPDYQNEFFRRYHGGNYRAALEWLRAGEDNYPQQSAALYYWRICLLCLLGQPDQAVSVLQEGLESGMWWSEEMLRQDPDLAGLLGRPDFENLIILSGDRQLQAQATSEPAMLVYAPEDQADGPAPLLLALHSRYGNAPEMAERFRHLTRSGWLVAVPQSSQVAYQGAYVWDKRPKAVSEIKDLLARLIDEVWVDEQNIVLAGYSQGGALALELALSGEIPACGVLGIAPYLRETTALEKPPTGWRQNGLRAWLITGGRDKAQDVFAGIERLLGRRAIPYRREHHPELDHAFPPDFPDSLGRALHFFLQGLADFELENNMELE